MFNNDNGAPRQMVQGNWTCSDCGKEITELPFQPSGDRPVHCKDCWAKKRSENRSNFQDRAPRQMVQGNWACSECGKEITELPFEPKGDRPVLCKDCWRAKRPARF